MQLVDQEKTSFITKHETYYYKVMSFRLKNISATYQCLVNKMFIRFLGDTMEVYINDMLVKLLCAINHVLHLEKAFNDLDFCQMKLNHKKCTFGISSG